MKKERKSVSLTSNVVEIVNNSSESLFGYDFSWKLNTMVEMFDGLVKSEKRNLVNYFTVNEAILIIACFNGSIYTHSIQPKTFLYINVEDSILLEGYDTLYNVDKDQILQKIEKLNELQAFAIITMIYEFWDKKITVDEENKELKKIFLIRD